ncbi:MAG: ABC transporter permease subunit [Actinomycetaceae bacterium]|nr:ABC transporter permease subunit [Actinomycetaceae bacterium]
MRVQTTSKIADFAASAVLIFTGAVSLVYPALVLVVRSVSAGRASSVSVFSIWRAVFWSVLDSAVVASVAVLVAAVLAVVVRGLPLRLGRVFDVLLIAPATVSPFVVSSALSVGFGREGLWEMGATSPFTGAVAVLGAFTVALGPFAYALLRISVSTVHPGLIDTYRVLGVSEWKILRNAAWPKVRRAIPIAWMVVFVLAISDPVVPSLLASPHPNAARSVWILATAVGDTTGAARLSVCLLVATFAVGGAAFLLSRPRGVLETFSMHSQASSRYSLSQPVGVPIAPRLLLVAFASIFTFLPFLLMLLTADEIRPESFAQLLSTALTIALLTIAGSVLIAGSGLWFKARRPHSHAIDILFGLALVVPGASTGTGLSLAYGPSSPISTLIPAPAQSAGSTLLIVIAYLTLSAPLTYMSARVYGRVFPKRDFETSLMLGATPLRATLMAMQAWLRRSVVLSFTIVLAVSAVSVAPIMWVTSPTTPLLVPYLYQLLDRTQFQTAFALALTVSGATMVLIFISALMLRLKPIRVGGRL